MQQYIQENRARFFEELFSLLRIPSVSAKPEHKADVILVSDTTMISDKVPSINCGMRSLALFYRYF